MNNKSVSKRARASVVQVACGLYRIGKVYVYVVCVCMLYRANGQNKLLLNFAHTHRVLAFFTIAGFSRQGERERERERRNSPILYGNQSLLCDERERKKERKERK